MLCALLSVSVVVEIMVMCVGISVKNVERYLCQHRKGGVCVNCDYTLLSLSRFLTALCKNETPRIPIKA